jgi:hypothetical protein
MSTEGPGNPRRFSPIGSPQWENYERFNKSDDQDEMQNDVFNIPAKKAPIDNLKKWRVSIYISEVFLS